MDRRRQRGSARGLSSTCRPSSTTSTASPTKACARALHDLARRARRTREAQRGLRRLQPRRLPLGPPDRRPFIPVSERVGSWNWANVQSAGGCCLVVGDQLHFYVSGRQGVPGTSGPACAARAWRRCGATASRRWTTARPRRASGVSTPSTATRHADDAAGAVQRAASVRERRRAAVSCASKCSTAKGARSRRFRRQVRAGQRGHARGRASPGSGARSCRRLAGEPVRFRFPPDARTAVRVLGQPVGRRRTAAATSPPAGPAFAEPWTMAGDRRRTEV